MTKYETTVVLDSFLKDEDKQNFLTKIENFIKNHGGEIEKIDEWGKKRMAYEINRKQYGIYIHMLYSGPGTLPKLLEREFQLDEAILRYLTVKFDPRSVEAEEPSEAQERPSDSAKDGDDNGSDKDSDDDETSDEKAKESEETVAESTEEEKQ